MKKDFEAYLLSVQKQVCDMNKAVEEANELIKEGKMDQQTAKVINDMQQVITTNYQRLLYCKHLYMLPPKFIQKIRQNKLRKEMEEFQKQQADAESVKAENQAAVDKANEVVTETKENGQDA